MEFKPGDFVRCIDNENSNVLKLNANYKVHSEFEYDKTCIILKFTKGIFNKDRFIPWVPQKDDYVWFKNFKKWGKLEYANLNPAGQIVWHIRPLNEKQPLEGNYSGEIDFKMVPMQKKAPWKKPDGDSKVVEKQRQEIPVLSAEKDTVSTKHWMVQLLEYRRPNLTRTDNDLLFRRNCNLIDEKQKAEKPWLYWTCGDFYGYFMQRGFCETTLNCHEVLDEYKKLHPEWDEWYAGYIKRKLEIGGGVG